MALTNPGEKRTLDWLTGQGVAAGSNGPGGTAPVAPVMPLMVRLITSSSVSDTVNGTEVVNGGGSTYAAKRVDFGPADINTGQCANSILVRFDNMPDTTAQGTVKAFEIWDSTPTTPVRWWWALLTAERSYQLGDAAEFPIGQLVLAME